MAANKNPKKQSLLRTIAPFVDDNPVSWPLFLQLAIFLGGFVLLISLNTVFSHLINNLSQATVNEQSRMFIGEQIIQELGRIETNAYKLATTRGVIGQDQINEEIRGIVNDIRTKLHVLEHGGTVSKTNRLNVGGHNEMTRTVTYNPQSNKSEFVLEVIDLKPKLTVIEEKVDELAKLLRLREQYRNNNEQQKYIATVNDIKFVLKKLPPLFLRLDENANRLFFESQQRLITFEQNIEQKQQLYNTIELLLAIVIIISVMGFGFVVSVQIKHNNERLHNTKEDMKRAKEEAEQASRAKSEFLSNMSHELRTPLNAILGFGQLLETEPLSKDQQESINEILRAGNHLLSLINEILDLAKIEAGKLELALRDVAIAEIVHDCMMLIQPMAEKHNITLHNTIPEDSDLVMRADPVRLKQILLNLLSNAVKYNRPNGEVTLCTAQVTPHRLQIKVRDTGPGIEEEQQQLLFQPFMRLNSIDSGIEGTGIGLVITKRLVEMMGGTIGVNSQPDKGSTFWFELDIAATTAAEKNNDTEKTSAIENFTNIEYYGGKQRFILYIEDNPANIRLVEQLIQKHPGITLFTATDPHHGLDLAITQSFDLILLDINLPGMNGYELLEKLRRSRHMDDTPIIAVSANALAADVERGLSAGFDHYLTKPINLDAFAEMLDQYLVAAAAN